MTHGLALVLLCLPSAALAEVCDKERPFWTPTDGPATLFDEALHLAANPISAGLLLLTAIAVRFRSQWGGLAAVCGWSILVSVIVFGNPSGTDEITRLAIAEGCIGSPALFIGVVAAICVATILYTAPSGAQSSD